MIRRQEIDPATGLKWAPGRGPVLDHDPITVGVDIGQRSDPTAIAVVEAQTETPYDGRSHFHVRALERLPLGTEYPKVARRIAQIVRNLQGRDLLALKGIGEFDRLPVRSLEVSLDVTGVGRPVYDIVADELKGLGVKVFPVTFRHGDRLIVTGKGRHAEVAVGKGYLVSRLQSLLQTRRITLPANHPETAALVRELLDYEIKVRENDAMETFGAFKTGAHDDLVTALGLACISDPGPVSRGSTVRAY